MEQNEDAKREAAEKLAAEYQAIVMKELFGFLTITSNLPTNEKETRPDPRLN